MKGGEDLELMKETLRAPKSPLLHQKPTRGRTAKTGPQEKETEGIGGGTCEGGGDRGPAAQMTCWWVGKRGERRGGGLLPKGRKKRKVFFKGNVAQALVKGVFVVVKRKRWGVGGGRGSPKGGVGGSQAMGKCVTKVCGGST